MFLDYFETIYKIVEMGYYKTKSDSIGRKDPLTSVGGSFFIVIKIYILRETILVNLNYFIESIPKIENNPELREPQVLAYQKLVEHFVVDKSREHAIVVLPTGVGKTGLMGILPFGISFGRVLIVTPQLVIKDAVLDSLDPEHPKNFWLTRNVFDDYNDLPSVIEYDSKTSMWALEQSNIVILNVQKLQERLDSSLINKVETDFLT